MPRAGGDSDKIGNRYEAVWTVNQILDVAEGKLADITVEPFGDDATGVEFVTTSPAGNKTFHSVKRQRAAGEWSLAEIVRRSGAPGRSVLGDLFAKLVHDPDAQCRFVSSTGANQLRELHERAFQYREVGDFQRSLQESPGLQKSFEERILKLVEDMKRAKDDWITAHDWLRRTRVVLIDEYTLIHQVEDRIRVLVYRPGGHALNAAEVRLGITALFTGSHGQKLDRASLWEALRADGYAHRDWASDPNIQQRIRTHHETYVRNVELDLINGSRIDRDEARQAIDELVRGDGACRVLVSAPAGVGKSCVVSQILDGLRVLGVPYLVVRFDRHGDAHTTEEMGRQMEGLPASPGVVLTGLADGRVGVMVVDQLDAVSEASGRNPHRWELFDALCREIDPHPNLRLLVACRDFDLDNDHRLRRLTRKEDETERISVQLLSLAQVEGSLTVAGHDLSRFSDKQRELLRIPLHLWLFLSGGNHEAAAFTTVSDLLDRFWQHKERAVSERLGRRADWSAVIDKVCDTMSDRQTLTAPEAVLDDWRDTANAMYSEHVLVREGNQVRFFHELFFDYAFARRFCASSQTISDFLRASEQHLFRRSQVRQILTHLRDTDPRRYGRELRLLLFDKHVRFHIKKLVLRWLASLGDPTDEEWRILADRIEDGDWEPHVLPVVRNSLAWFDVLDRIGVVLEWLESQEERLNQRAVWTLTFDGVRKERSERVAELLGPRRGCGKRWDDLLRAAFQWGDVHQSRPMQELFLQLLDDGLLDEMSGSFRESWWDLLQDATKAAPGFVIEAITHWLDRQIDSARKNTADIVIDPQESDNAAQLVISEVANLEPSEFANLILPRVLDIVEITQQEESEWGDLRRDRTWPYMSNHEAYNVADVLLHRLVTSLEELAKETPNAVEELFGGLDKTEYDTVAHIVLRAWSANPEFFADRAIRFLASDNARLDVGYGSWSGEGTGQAAVSRETITNCLPHASTENKQQLEQAVLAFTDLWEREHEEETASPSVGWTQRLLLEAVGEKNLSEAGANQLRRLRATFPEQITEVPVQGRSVLPRVGSPIPAEEAESFTDDQWLEAMRKYDYGWETPRRDSFKGSAVELSRILVPQVRQEMERFAQLVNRMADDIHSLYFESILDGMCGRFANALEDRELHEAAFKELDTKTLLAVIHRLHELPNRPCGRSICGAYAELANRSIPEADLAILEYYALKDPDPKDDHWLNKANGQERDPDAHFHGYNSVRGSAAQAIQRLLFADYSRDASLLPVVEKMADDPCLSVRTCVFDAILPIWDHDRARAVAIFNRTCEGADEILGCQPFEHFVNLAVSTHYDSLRPVLFTALRQEAEWTVVAAARQICVAAFDDEQAEADAKDVRNGTPVMRVAAAEVYALNLANKTVGPACSTHLEQLFRDDVSDVREKAAECFHHLGDEELGRLEDLIRKYLESPAFPSRHDGLLRVLDRSTWQLPDVTIRLAERFMETHGKSAGDISTAAAGDAPTVAKLVLRLYTQSPDENVQARCLDLIDQMEWDQFFGMDRELAQHDR
ncbi:MAG: hypothetical protein HQ581_05785 [Planctomycetes bacterium]|nr:hypothetical protein [Planctomycetota bacterium]